MKSWIAVRLMIGALFCFAGAGCGNGATAERELSGRLDSLRHALFIGETSGHRNIPAHQILAEAEWLLSSTRDYRRLSERLDALHAAIDAPSNLTASDEQSPEDGAWGRWHTEWFFKLTATYAQLEELADQGGRPKYPLRFLDRINSPELLKAHLERLLVSDPERDGIKHRRELNETLSVLVRMIVRDRRNDYAFHPQLRQALLEFLEEARDPKTGYWCDRYGSRPSPRMVLNVSTTFHIVSYLKGKISNWPKVIDTTLAIKNKAWPAGWLAPSGYLNHHNMDVVELFRLGWSHASEPQREAMRKEIRKMLTWCLQDSLQSDGSFRVVEEDDDSIETSIYFGTSFLGRLGYFDPSRRFWTDEAFPESDVIRQRIGRFIRAHFDSGGEGGHFYHGALQELRTTQELQNKIEGTR